MDHVSHNGTVWWTVRALLFQRLRGDGRVWVAIAWVEPPGGFTEEDWVGEDRGSVEDGDYLPELYPDASWRPSTSIIQPRMTVASLSKIPVTPLAPSLAQARPLRNVVSCASSCKHAACHAQVLYKRTGCNLYRWQGKCSRPSANVRPSRGSPSTLHSTWHAHTQSKVLEPSESLLLVEVGPRGWWGSWEGQVARDGCHEQEG
mmetsp:Transcript_8528/g.20969  ORF Transcript_8528/g.20969 Transcript_8528/m.20969 type:complete len:203 (-) Transcript_8528:4367-4975(-)